MTYAAWIIVLLGSNGFKGENIEKWGMIRYDALVQCSLQIYFFKNTKLFEADTEAYLEIFLKADCLVSW